MIEKNSKHTYLPAEYPIVSFQTLVDTEVTPPSGWAHTFCLAPSASGLGNSLSDYFLARVIARLSGARFAVSNRCEFYDFNGYLPVKVPAPQENDPHDYWPAPPPRVSSRWLRRMARHLGKRSRTKHEFFHASPISPYLLRWFGPAITRDLRLAQDTYWQERPDTRPQSTEHDIVIHFRCGDIISGEFTKWGYGFPCVEYYARAVLAALYEDPTPRNLWVLLNTKRRDDTPYSNECETFVDDMTKLVTRTLGSRHKQTYIISDGTVSEDFYRISNAYLFIGSISTFSLWGALGNGRNSVLPIVSSNFFFSGIREPIKGMRWLESGMLLPSLNKTSKIVTIKQVGMCM